MSLFGARRARWFLGAAGPKIEASPGSRHFQMLKTKSVRRTRPFSRIRRKQGGRPVKTSNVATTTYNMESSAGATAGTGSAPPSSDTPSTKTPTSGKKSVSGATSD
eukprot:8745097-Pyramimonas_sp.AAC.1